MMHHLSLILLTTFSLTHAVVAAVVESPPPPSWLQQTPDGKKWILSPTEETKNQVFRLEESHTYLFQPTFSQNNDDDSSNKNNNDNNHEMVPTLRGSNNNAETNHGGRTLTIPLPIPGDWFHSNILCPATPYSTVFTTANAWPIALGNVFTDTIEITTHEFSASGNLLFLGQYDTVSTTSQFSIQNAQTGAVLYFPGPTAPNSYEYIRSIAVHSPSMKFAYSYQCNVMIGVWASVNWQYPFIGVLDHTTQGDPSTCEIPAMKFSKDGKFLMTYSYRATGTTLTYWNVSTINPSVTSPTGKVVKVRTFLNMYGGPSSFYEGFSDVFSLSPDGTKAAVVVANSTMTTVHIVSLPQLLTTKILTYTPLLHVWATAYSPDGLKLAIGGSKAYVYNSVTYAIIKNWNPLPTDLIQAMAWSPLSDMLAFHGQFYVSVSDLLGNILANIDLAVEFFVHMKLEFFTHSWTGQNLNLAMSKGDAVLMYGCV
jgi:hypothetical protein